MDARAPRAPALYLRILLAWLLAMQPMVGGYAAAALAADAPLALELCRGGTAPADQPSGSTVDHLGCCLAACLGANAPPPEQATLAARRRFDADARIPAHREPVIRRAGLGTQTARAPPASNSSD